MSTSARNPGTLGMASPPGQSRGRPRGRPKTPGIERRLIRAAQACFSSRAYDDVAIDDLARKVGVSKATIYVYFRSKQDLFHAALDSLLARLPRASELTSTITGASIEDRLLVLAERLGRVLSSPGFQMALQGPASDARRAARDRLLDSIGAPYFQAIDGYFRAEAAREALDLDDSRLATAVFIALIIGHEALFLHGNKAMPGCADGEYLRGAVRAFVKGHAVHSHAAGKHQ